jgi:hypothetical protein
MLSANLGGAGHPAAALHPARFDATDTGIRLSVRLHRSCRTQLGSRIRSVRLVEETGLAGLNQLGAHLSASLGTLGRFVSVGGRRRDSENEGDSGNQSGFHDVLL